MVAKDKIGEWLDKLSEWLGIVPVKKPVPVPVRKRKK
jgi:hypothetical protein